MSTFERHASRKRRTTAMAAAALMALIGAPSAWAGAANMDVAVSKSVNTASALIGDQIIYTIGLTNRGVNAADTLVITDNFPVAVTHLGHQASLGTYNSTTRLWSVGSLLAGATQTLLITGQVNFAAGPTVTNIARFVSSADTDTNAANNIATALFSVVTTDLGVGKSADTNAVEIGSNVTFTLSVTNFGPLDATNVEVTDLLAGALSYVSHSGGAYNPTTGVWTIGSLLNGAVTTLTLTAQLGGSAAGKTVTNMATISNAQQADDNAANNSGAASVQGGRNDDPDLAVPPINLEVIPAGSYIIPMDTNHQRIGTTIFNMRSYGLVSALLHTNTPVKWAIRAGKEKDEADFSAYVRILSPTGVAATNTAVTNLSFYAGPFIVVSDFTNRARSVIQAYGQNVAVYQLMSNTVVDIRYTLTHKPKVAVFNDGDTQDIHTDILDAAGIPTNHYAVLNASAAGFLGATSCFTLATSPHFDGGTTASQQTTAVRAFLESGGNFLAQCAAVRTYENSSNGQFHTTSGFQDQNDASAFVYLNADTPTVQFQGALNDAGGSLQDWGLLPSSVFKDQTYLTIVNAASTNAVTPNTNSFRSATGKVHTNLPGSCVFYLGGHSYGSAATDLGLINGQRVLMNAVFVPVERPTECGITFTVDLRIRKTDDIDPIIQGSNLTYSILVSNSGPFTADGVVVTDTLPAQVTFLSAIVSTGTYNSTSGVWSIGSMPMHDVETLTLTVNVSSNFTGIMTNKVTVSSEEGDIEPTNNVAFEPTTVICEVEPPGITCPDDITIECTESLDPTNTGFAVALDNSDPNPIVTYSNTVIAGECAAEMTVVRVWTATDACSNSASCTQFISVVDTTAPELSGVPANATNECDNVSTAAVVTATDNCDTNVPVDFAETTNAGACAQSYTLVRVWTATDDCGNSVSATQLVSVVDTMAPQLDQVPGNATNACDDVSEPDEVFASDNCDPNPSVGFVETTNASGQCGQNYTLVRVWTATDACGNSSSQTQLVTVVDTVAPELSGVPANATNECDNVSTAAVVTATDNCDTNVPVDFAQTTNAGACAQSYTLVRVWTATDDCGNSVSATQLVEVVDTTDPQLQGVPANATNECDNVSTAAVVTATDNCDTNVPVNFAETTNAGACASSYTLVRVWSASDDCGNGVVATQLVSVVDTTAPQIVCATNSVTLAGDANCQAELPQLSADASDNCDTNVLVTQNPPAGTVITGDSNTIVTLTATDDCGNTNTCQVIVSVVCPGDIFIQKTVYLGHDGGASCPGSESVAGTVGDAITYCFTVTNAGAVTLTNVVVNDATIVPPLSTNLGTLAVGQSVTIFVETTLAGNLTNVATTAGTDPIGREVGDTNTAQTVENNSICGSVFEDADGDGLFDPEDITNGIPGVTVTLLQGTNVLGTTTTDANGGYCFTNLPAGSYTVVETDPAGYLSTADIVPPNDNTIPVTLVSGTNSTGNDFLDVRAAAVGDFAWREFDLNGIQNFGELGVVPPVRLTLRTTNDVPLLVVTSALNGVYFFTNLYPGPYLISVAFDFGFALVTNDAGANDNLDSDFFPLSMRTAPFTLLPGEVRTNMDVGLCLFVNAAPGVTVEGRVEPDGRAVLAWEQEAGQNAAGWYVERQDSEGAWTRVSPFVPGTGDSASGGSYAWHDPAARVGGTYTYQLNEVAARGGTRILGPYRVTFQAPARESSR